MGVSHRRGRFCAGAVFRQRLGAGRHRLPVRPRHGHRHPADGDPDVRQLGRRPLRPDIGPAPHRQQRGAHERPDGFRCARRGGRGVGRVLGAGGGDGAGGGAGAVADGGKTGLVVFDSHGMYGQLAQNSNHQTLYLKSTLLSYEESTWR